MERWSLYAVDVKGLRRKNCGRIVSYAISQTLQLGGIISVHASLLNKSFHSHTIGKWLSHIPSSRNRCQGDFHLQRALSEWASHAFAIGMLSSDYLIITDDSCVLPFLQDPQFHGNGGRSGLRMLHKTVTSSPIQSSIAVMLKESRLGLLVRP